MFSAAEDTTKTYQTNQNTVEDSGNGYGDGCGPVALQETLKTQCKNITTIELAEQAGTDETGTTMQGMINAAEKNGVKLYGVKREASQLQNGAIILLKTDEWNHYAIVKNVNDQNITLIDPSATGEKNEFTLPLDTFNQIYTGEALTTKIPSPNELLKEKELQIKGQGKGKGKWDVVIYLINEGSKVIGKLSNKSTKFNKTLQKEVNKTLKEIKKTLNNLRSKARKTAIDIVNELALQTVCDNLQREYCKYLNVRYTHLFSIFFGF